MIPSYSGCVYVWKFHRADLESSAYAGLGYRPTSSSSSFASSLHPSPIGTGTGFGTGLGAGVGDWDDDDAMTHASHTTGGVSLSMQSHATGASGAPRDGARGAPSPGPLADDGKKLHSLLQSSQHPVVQVTFCCCCCCCCRCCCCCCRCRCCC